MDAKKLKNNCKKAEKLREAKEKVIREGQITHATAAGQADKIRVY